MGHRTFLAGLLWLTLPTVGPAAELPPRFPKSARFEVQLDASGNACLFLTVTPQMEFIPIRDVSTVGQLAAPMSHGPFLAASALYPGRWPSLMVPARDQSETPPSPEQEIREALGAPITEVQSRLGPGTLSFEARCDGAFQRRLLLAEGQIDLTPVLRVVRPLKVESLSVTIHLPPVPFVRGSDDNLQHSSRKHAGYYAAQVAVDGPEPPVIHLAYGYRLSDLLFLWPIPVMLLTPIGLVLWRRRAALRQGKLDPAAAWFGYAQFLGLLVLGTILGWMALAYGLELQKELGQLVSFVQGEAAEEPSDDAEASSSRVSRFLREMFTGEPEPSGDPAALSPGRELLSHAFIFLPPLLLVLLCVALSQPVQARLRGLDFTRWEMVCQVFWQQSALLVPLVFGLVGLQLLVRGKLRSAVIWFLAALVGRVVIAWIQKRWQDRAVQALTVGELRDRVFELAEKASVKVQQVYVLFTGRSREANAAAVLGDTVVLTDQLLQHMSRREVDAVVAHELAHLRGRHPRAVLIYAILGFLALCLPLGLLAGAAFLFPQKLRPLAWWLINPQYEDLRRWFFILVPMTVLLIVFLFQRFRLRRFERAADAGAVELTGDPEAMITSLAKLARINVMPLQWGKWEGRLLTHPATSLRLQAIAQDAGLPPGRLEEIVAAPAADTEQYTIPVAVSSAERVFSTEFRQRKVQQISWALLAVYVVTPALAAAMADWAGWQGAMRVGAYVTGLAATVALYLAVLNWMSVSGYERLRQRLSAKLRREGQLPDGPDGGFVSFAPEGVPRLYEGFNDWDIGFLHLAGGRLCYVGEQTRFALTRDQITDVYLSASPPSWLSAPRLCLAWQDAARGTSGIFTIHPAVVRSQLRLGRASAELGERLRRWWKAPDQPDEPLALGSPLAELSAPEIGPVTSLVPSAAVSANGLVVALVITEVLALGVCVLFGLSFSWSRGGAAGYVLVVAFLMTLFQLIPLWRYRESAESQGTDRALLADRKHGDEEKC